MNIKINNKNYTVPQLGFRHMTQMEDMGFSVMEMLGRKQLFSIATAFAGIVVGCDRETAEELIQQHVLGGGDIIPIYEAFQMAVDQSVFFKKLLEQAENKTVRKDQTPSDLEEE